MDRLEPKGKSDRLALAPANCNNPVRWRSLEEAGIQVPYVGGVAELAAVLACYAETKEDHRDLKGAAALLYDVRNRMERRRSGAVCAHG